VVAHAAVVARGGGARGGGRVLLRRALGR
jgi:hypothetical protein